MIKCPACGTENIDQAVFCSNCGFAFGPSPSAYPPMSAYPPGYSFVKPGDRSKNWAAILGLVLGILSIPCCFGGFFFFNPNVYATLYIPAIISGVIGTAGLIFSIIGMKSTKKGLAIGGLICAIVGLVMAALFAGIISTPEYRELFYEMLRDSGLY